MKLPHPIILDKVKLAEARELYDKADSDSEVARFCHAYFDPMADTIEALLKEVGRHG